MEHPNMQSYDITNKLTSHFYNNVCLNRFSYTQISHREPKITPHRKRRENLSEVFIDQSKSAQLGA